MGDLVGYEQDSKVQFVIDAVYAFAYALDKLRSDVCPNFKGEGLCPAMAHYDGGQFYKNYLLNVDFIGEGGSRLARDLYIFFRVVNEFKGQWGESRVQLSVDVWMDRTVQCACYCPSHGSLKTRTE